MNEIERIQDQHSRAFDGDPWYGFPLMKLLAGVVASQAAARPIPSAHTIWEIVLHIAAWEGAVLERLQSGSVAQPAEGDWPEVAVQDDQAWQMALQHLKHTHKQLGAFIRGVDEGSFDQRLGAERDLSTGGGLSVGGTLHGIIQHNVYHTGQIALLRRSLGI